MEPAGSHPYFQVLSVKLVFAKTPGEVKIGMTCHGRANVFTNGVHHRFSE
jgi:hypothetical protein